MVYGVASSWQLNLRNVSALTTIKATFTAKRRNSAKSSSSHKEPSSKNLESIELRVQGSGFRA